MDVRVENGVVDRGQADIASGEPDDGNGRFTELGWAEPFDTHGRLRRTVTWRVGDPPPTIDFPVSPEEGR